LGWQLRLRVEAGSSNNGVGRGRYRCRRQMTQRNSCGTRAALYQRPCRRGARLGVLFLEVAGDGESELLEVLAAAVE
jgi:hypothetical protein